MNSLQTRENDKESSSETNLRSNSLQEGGNDRGLSQDSIQEELEDEPLQFKGKEQEVERSKLFKAPNVTSNLKLKEYEDHSLKHIWRIIFRKISLCF